MVRFTHRTIKRVTTDLTEFQFNTQIAAMIELTNELMRLSDTDLVGTKEWRFAVTTLVSLLAPSAPHVAEEMWEMLGHEYSIHTAEWPSWDEALTIDAMVEIAIQVNGKPRDRISVPNDATEDAVRELAHGIRARPGASGWQIAEEGDLRAGTANQHRRITATNRDVSSRLVSAFANSDQSAAAPTNSPARWGSQRRFNARFAATSSSRLYSVLCGAVVTSSGFVSASSAI